MPACADQAGVAPQRAVTLSELTPHLVCPLCGGYYVDATAIVECLHTFCRSCILLHLHTTRRCPVEGCDVLVQKAQGASAANLRPDATLQSIVYKTVPGLHRDEMQRRRLFYADNQDNAAGTPSGPKATEEDQGSAFYDASDIIDLQIQYAPQRPGDVVPVRYLRCPAGTPLSVLSKFLRRKYQLSEDLRVELLCDSRRLPGDIKLLDVLYMVNWDRVRY
ncbi:polycomb complex protein BMI-1-B-like isoform X2 [Amphibalanus amphitrite]|uniref:polycomb complex protein BMI-1-B-like isoform X2 n=1 Tax=Amphibalanus amphitrite TaxID=1232801 RepID=UPI001C924672|nr:polycomb complex protein BMI-1-B-like isoform X2 [Amphibalanus amphitrite]